MVKRHIYRFESGVGFSEHEDLIISEQSLTLAVNGRDLITLLCSPEHLEDLTVGYLLGEGLIISRDDISELSLDTENMRISVSLSGPLPEEKQFKRYLASGAGKGVDYDQLLSGPFSEKYAGHHRIDSQHIIEMMKKLQENSVLHKATGGVHTAALGHEGELLIQRDDIGRHNAVDKVIGSCFRNGLEMADKALLLSGRISSEMVSKTIKSGVQVLVSKSAPTDAGIDMAEKAGLTLIGFTRGSKFNTYCHPYRII